MAIDQTDKRIEVHGSDVPSPIRLMLALSHIARV